MATADRPVFDQSELPEQLQEALRILVDQGAKAPTVMHVGGTAGYTDWVVVVSARSQRHVKSLTATLDEGLGDLGVEPLGRDGRGESSWAILDYDDFMVHVFHHPMRRYFDLESMWSDAPQATLHLPPRVMDTSDLDQGSLLGSEPALDGVGGFAAFPGELDGTTGLPRDHAAASDDD